MKLLYFDCGSGYMTIYLPNLWNCILKKEKFIVYKLYLNKHSRKKLIPASQQTGEGNGTPLQYSCLENPMDGGAW